jgi:opacity protein-like surface antigen
MHKRSVVVGLMLFLVHANSSTAAADSLLTPYLGGALFDVPGTGFRPSVGGSFLWSGPVTGVELDLNTTPNFLEGATTVERDKRGLFSLVGNGVVRFPTRSSRLRPYAVAGVGLLYTNVTTTGGATDSGRSSFGFNAGGGVTAFLSSRVGLRGDVRYLRAIQDDAATAESEALGLEPLHLVRATVGVTFRF